MGTAPFKQLLLIMTFCIGAFAVVPALDAKDHVTLRTGELFSGQVLRITDREVAIQLDSGAFISFRRFHIKKVQRYLPGQELPEIIDFDNLPTSDREDGLATTETSTPASPISPNSTPGIDGNIDAESPILIGSALSNTPPTDFLDVVTSEEGEDWTFRVPSGFELWHPDEGIEVVEAWMDPVTQAVITVSIHPQIGSGEDYRALTLGTLQRTLQPRIFRDQPIKDRDDEEKPNGWLVDTEQTIAGNATRQLQLFVNRNDKTYILRCSSPAEIFKKYVDHFEECVRSFQIHSSNDSEK
jgi:hypothetical protein